jgi:tetratricopeptide (TPR) repeat protein
LGALPDRIAANLSPLLLRGVSGAGSQRLLGSTANPEAYNLAFQASAALAQRSKEQVESAIKLYQEALSIDPRFARAWSGLAESYLVLANFGTGAETDSSFSKARQAATQALALDPSNAEAHSTLGFVLLQHDWRLAEAEQQIRLAIAGNPGSAANHLHLAVLLTDEGRFADAGNSLDHATEVDPDWPVIHGTAMYVHIMGRQYAKAIGDAQALVHGRPDWGRAHRHLGWAFWYGGKHMAAVNEWERADQLDKSERSAATEKEGRILLEQKGVRAYAEFKLARQLASPPDDDFVAAEWYAFAGNADQTLGELEKMVKSHSPESLKIPWNPAYDFVRSSPRFEAVLRTIAVH